MQAVVRSQGRSIGAGPDTALLLQGDTSAPPLQWNVRRVRVADDASRAAALAATPRRNRKVRTIVCLIVLGMELLEEARDPQEQKLRHALHRLRASVATALHSANRLEQGMAPVVVEAQWSPELLQRGRVARVLEKGLKLSLDEEAGEEEAGAAPKIVAKSYKSMGCRRWTGVTVALPKGVPERQAKGDRASKDLTAELNLQKEGRQLVYVAPSEADPTQRPLPECHNPVSCPLGLAALDGKEVGTVCRIDCAEAIRATEPGALIVKGGVDESVQKSALVARTFVRLYQPWLEEYFGVPFVRDPATARILLHVHGYCTKDGPSLGPALAVGIAAYYLNLRVHDWVAVTGDASLSGDLVAVGGVREKLLGAYKHYGSSGGTELAEPPRRLTVVLPSDNVVGGVVGEVPDFLDGTAAYKIQFPRALREELVVQEAADLFTMLALAILPPEGHARPQLVRPPRQPHSLSLARCIHTNDRGGMLVVMECALLQPGSGKVEHALDANALLMDSLELGLTWLEQRWQEDMVAHYATDIRHRPADRHYDLHFHCPVCLAPDMTYLSAAAMVSVIALLLGKVVPEDIVIIAEVRLDGGLLPLPDGLVTPRLTLDVAKANGIRRIITAVGKAAELEAEKMQHKSRYQGIEIMAARDMLEILKAVW